MRVGIAMIEGYRFALDPVFLGFEGMAATARKIEALGFDEIISSETAGHDPFVPLLLAAEHTQQVRLSTGIAVSFPRSPMSVAQMTWDLQRLSGGRFALLGIPTSPMTVARSERCLLGPTSISWKKHIRPMPALCVLPGTEASRPHLVRIAGFTM